ncbi:MAG: methionyl-tRNA formyltransferase [Actinomycetota bacterium]
MFETRIIFFGTRGWELTSFHLGTFLSSSANIIAFVEALPDMVSSTVKQKKPYESIDKAARRLNIPIFCPRNLKDENLINSLAGLGADIFIVCGYQFYLPKEILDIPPMGAVNFHSSLLPRHCGMHPGFWTIWYGDKKSGMSVHFMDEGLDTGDIIYQTKVEVLSGDTIEALYGRIWDSSPDIISRLLSDLDSNSVPRRPQDMSKYFYNYDIGEKDFELDFRQPAEVLYGRVKMMPSKFYFILKGEKYYVLDCSVEDKKTKAKKIKLGIPLVIKNRVYFATPQKFLQIKKILHRNKRISPL